MILLNFYGRASILIVISRSFTTLCISESELIIQTQYMYIREDVLFEMKEKKTKDRMCRYTREIFTLSSTRCPSSLNQLNLYFSFLLNMCVCEGRALSQLYSYCFNSNTKPKNRQKATWKTRIKKYLSKQNKSENNR
jgi:hypothetical protein